MTLNADQIVDRRRIRRKLSFWRVVAFLLALIVLLGLLSSAGFGFLDRRTGHIARVELTGIIVESRPQIELLKRIADNRSVKALIVAIDTPGGTTTGAEALFDAIRDVAGKKPVVAQLGTLATSAGYATAVAADHIVSRRNTITGSIGVLVQWANVTELLDTLGVDVETIKSGPLKAEPSPFEPTSEAAREAVQAMVLDSYDWFVELVAERRSLEVLRVRGLADGRIMTGRQAVEVGLVDSLGGEEEVIEWLAVNRGVDADLPVRTWRPSSTGLEPFGLGGAVAWAARFTGFDALAGAVERVVAISGAGLDGLVSVWHPQPIEE